MKKSFLLVLALLFVLAVLAFTPGSIARADEMSCPTPVPVSIDIKPGSYPNSIKLSSQGLLPVAVLTTSDFDASQFQPEMAHLNDASAGMTAGCTGAMSVSWKLADVNKDRKLDLVFFFQIQDLTLTPASTAATFMAHGTYEGTTIHIMGTDSVRVVP